MAGKRGYERTCRNIRALLVLWLVLSFVEAAGGLVILLGAGQTLSGKTMPVWEFGQAVMFSGATFLGVGVALWWQVRKLMRLQGDYWGDQG